MNGLVQDCGIFTANVLRYYSHALSHGNDLFISSSIYIQTIKWVQDETIMFCVLHGITKPQRVKDQPSYPCQANHMISQNCLMPPRTHNTIHSIMVEYHVNSGLIKASREQRGISIGVLYLHNNLQQLKLFIISLDQLFLSIPNHASLHASMIKQASPICS